MFIKQQNSRLCLMLIFLLGISLSFLGCSKEPAPQQDTPKEPLSVTIMLDWSPNTNHTGLFVAKEKGYFKDQGLEVDIVSPSSQGTAEKLVATGNVDFGISHQEQVTTARINDLPIVSVAAILQHNTSGFASLKSENIQNAKDFEGKAYGGWGFPSETAVLSALMKKENADINKIEMVNIGEADQLASLNKDIDLVWIFYGWTGIQAELRNLDLEMLWLKDIDPALDYYTPVLITNEKLIQERPEIVSKLVKAVSEGYNFSIQNPEKAAEILIKHAPENDPDMIKKSQAWLSPKYQAEASRWGEQKEKVWEGYAKWLYDNELVPKMIEPSKAFTNEFLPNS